MAINEGSQSIQKLRPQGLEAKRWKLELDFMTAREIFYASPGWQNLSHSDQESIRQAFLRVFVAEQKLAW